MVAVKKNLKFVQIEYENEKDDTLDTSSIKHEISDFYVASRPSRTGKAKKCTQKSVMLMKSPCFAHSGDVTYTFHLLPLHPRR